MLFHILVLVGVAFLVYHSIKKANKLKSLETQLKEVMTAHYEHIKAVRNVVEYTLFMDEAKKEVFTKQFSMFNDNMLYMQAAFEAQAKFLSDIAISINPSFNLEVKPEFAFKPEFSFNPNIELPSDIINNIFNPSNIIDKLKPNKKDDDDKKEPSVIDDAKDVVDNVVDEAKDIINILPWPKKK